MNECLKKFCSVFHVKYGCLTYTRSEMGSIEIHVSAIRIARYFCIDIGIALATFQSIVYRYRLTHILRIADTCIANTNFTVT